MERNVEIKVFASYSNVTCGARGMNRMSFVGLKRVGGREIYVKKKGRMCRERKKAYNANPFTERTVERKRIAQIESSHSETHNSFMPLVQIFFRTCDP